MWNKNAAVRGVLAGLSIVMCLLLLACDEKADTDDQNIAVKKHLKQAEYYISQGQYKAAMIEARNAMQKDPRSLEGVVLISRVMTELGQYNQVIKTLEPISDKLDGEGKFTLAEAYRQRGKFQSSLALLNTNEKTLKSIDPNRYLNLVATNQAGLGEFAIAQKSFEEVLKSSPNNFNATLGLAKLSASLGKNDELEKYISELESSNPNNPELLVFKARLAVAQGDLAGSEELLTRALQALPTTDEMTPMRAGVISMLAEILSRQKRSAEALRYSKLLAEAFPGAQEAQGQYQNALELFSEGKLSEAEEVLHKLLETSPAFDKAGQLLGIINFLQGDYGEADMNFAQNLDPELATDKVKEVFALNSMRLNKPEEVLELLGPDLKSTDSANIWGMYGIAALGDGKGDEGVKALEKALSLDPSKARIHLVLADYFNKKAKPESDKALKHVQEAFKVMPDDKYVQRAVLAQYSLMDRDSDAKAFAEKLENEYGSQLDIRMLLGEFFLSSADLKAAANQFEKAVALKPGDLKANLALANVYVRQNQADKARPIYEKLIKEQPNEAQAYQGLMVAGGASGDWESAVKKIKDLAAKNNNAAPHLALANFYLGRSNFSEAKNFLQKAESIDPENPVLSRLRAGIDYGQAMQSMAEGNLDEARVGVLSALKVLPESSTLLAFLAELELKSKNFKEVEEIIAQVGKSDKALANHLKGDLAMLKGSKDEALSAFESSWEQRPNNALGGKIYNAYMQSGRAEKAENFLAKEWVGVFPYSGKARALMGGNFLAKGDYKKAQEQFELGLRSAPNSPVLLNNLAWVMQELKDERALAVAAKAAALAPENAAVLDTYGWILWQNGKATEAEKVLTKAQELAPGNKEIADHLKTVKQGS